MALTRTKKRIDSEEYDINEANQLIADKINVAYDIEEDGVVLTTLVKTINIWPELTTAEKNAAQVLYNRKLVRMAQI